MMHVDQVRSGRSGPVRAFWHAAIGWSKRHPRLSGAFAIVGVAAAFAPSVALIVWPDLTEPLERYSYAGVFLVNLVSTGTLFFPIPGVTAAANVLIATEASRSSYPWLIGIAGGAGMAIGELTAYYAGVAGSGVAEAHSERVPARFRPALHRLSILVRRLMERWGMLTLFVLAAIPEPVFEFAAVTAGSIRMPLARYFTAILAGCLVRGLTLAYLGSKLPFLT